LAGVTAYASVNFLSGLIKQTSQAADAASKMGQRMGLTTESVQELQHAAGLSGTSVDALGVAFLKLNEGLDQAAKTGESKAVSALRKLGISTNEQAVRTRDMEGILALVSDRFAALPNDARKTQLAVGLFGEAGAAL